MTANSEIAPNGQQLPPAHSAAPDAPGPAVESAAKPARTGRHGRSGPNRDWREVARLLADGHHPIVVARQIRIPHRALRRQLRRSRRLRGWIEELRRANADHVGWRLQAMRGELAEALRDAIRTGDRLLVRWLAQELGLAHVPSADPAGAPPEPKARALAGRYEPSAVAAARAAETERAAELKPGNPPKPGAPSSAGAPDEPGDTIVWGDWDENGKWIDPRTAGDHARQVWVNADGRKSVVIGPMQVVDWHDFVRHRIAAAQAKSAADRARREAAQTAGEGAAGKAAARSGAADKEAAR